MAKPISISRILDKEEFPDDMTVMCVKGTLIKLFPQKAGTHPTSGAWCFQNGTLKDDTGEIEVSFSKCTQPDSAKGQEVTIECFQTDKHGWQGLKVKDESYLKDGQTVKKRKLHVTPTATITYANGKPAANQQQPPAEPGKPTGAGTGGGQSSGGGQPWVPINAHPEPALADIMKLHRRCHDLVTENYGEGGFPPEYVAQVFIQATREKLHLNYIARAKAEVPKNYPPAPRDPHQWKECVIPKGEHEGKTLSEIPDEVLLNLFSYYDSKGANTPFAECVYQASRDRNVIPPPPPPKAAEKDPDLDPDAEDDIPF
jgi:hypothetical protein